MRRVFCGLWLLCGLLLAPWVAAQPVSVSNMGTCWVPKTNQVFALQEQWFAGQVSWWMRDPPVGPHINQVFRVGPDPSGINFLAVTSGVAGSQFWVTWDMKIIEVQWNGGVSQIGHCQVLSAFAQKFYRPLPPPPPVWTTAEFGFSGSPAQETPKTVKVPNLIMEASPDQEFARPIGLTMTAEQATACAQASGKNQDAFYECMLLKNLGPRELEAYKCMKASGGDEGQTTLCLATTWTGLKDNTVAKQALNCYQQNKDKWELYPLCMAGQASNQEVQNLVACARENFSKGSTDVWGMAACYAGPKLLEGMNPESMIAAQCAVQSGGNPKLFAACTGGQLTIREIDKCFQHGIGGKNGCFGENNTIVKAFREAEDQIIVAFGRDSPVHVAWRVATMGIDPTQTMKVANDVSREAGRALENVSREGTVAAKNVAKETEKAARKISNVLPRVTVKRIKITL